MFDYEAAKRYYFEKGHADHAGHGRFESAFYHTIKMVHDQVREQTLAESADRIACLQSCYDTLLNNAADAHERIAVLEADIKTLCAALKTSGEGNARLLDLLPAAEAVIERWDSPAWKDVPHTGEFIARLLGAVLAVNGNA